MIRRVVSPILKNVPPIIETFNNFLRGVARLCHSFCFYDKPESNTSGNDTRPVIRGTSHRMDSAESRQKTQVDLR